MLVNRDGEILIGSDRDRIDARIETEVSSFFRVLQREEIDKIIYRIDREARGSSEVFYIAFCYNLIGTHGLEEDGHPSMMRMGCDSGGTREDMVQMQQSFWR